MLSYSQELVPGIILTKSYLGLAGAIVITVLFVNSLYSVAAMPVYRKALNPPSATTEIVPIAKAIITIMPAAI